MVDDPALKDSVARACFGPGSTFNRFAAQAPILVISLGYPDEAMAARPKVRKELGSVLGRNAY